MMVTICGFAHQMLFTLTNRREIRGIQKKNSSANFIFCCNGFVAKIGTYSGRRG